MTGILLAGGKSRRMGNDKAFLEFREKKLFEYPLSILKENCDEILISSSDKRFRKLGFMMISDLIENIGPLGGIYSSLKNAAFKKAVILSCDIPFITTEYIHYLKKNSSGRLITAGQNKYGQPEPLAGIYDTQVSQFIDILIKKREYRLSRLFELTGDRCLQPSENGFDTDKLFYNINEPVDLKEAVKII